VIFVSCDYIGVALMLLYINNRSGGNWFLTFALPLCCGVALINIAVIALTRYLRHGLLCIFGGALILTGTFMMVIEYLINLTFGLRDHVIWSFYPFIILALLGVMLIIIEICPPIKESLRKKFFL